MVFWAGLIAVVVGAVVGVIEKRRNEERALLVTVATTVATYVLVTIVWALAT